MLNRITAIAAVAASALLLSTAVGAADFPSGPIKIVHGSSAGAPQDVMVRRLATSMEAIAGVPVVVEPRPGGTGQVAMAYLKGQAADGHTIFNDATGITSVLQLPGAAHKWTDFKPLYRIQLDPFALYTSRDSDHATLDALLAAMKDKPGQIRVGGYGTGSPHQITTLIMAELAGVEATWVPFSSGGDAINAVMSGDIEAAMSNISVYGRFKERTQVVAVTSEERVAAHSEVPTFVELGHDLARYHWRGMFVHGDTPDDTVDKLYAILDEAMQSEDFQNYLSESSTLEGTMSQADFRALLEQQAVADEKMLKSLGMLQ
jgi:putative tricarboxylic transport membrane protein